MRESGYLCMSCWALCRDKTAEWISFRWFISFPHWAHRLSNPAAKHWRTLCFAPPSLVVVMKNKPGSPSKWLAVIKLSQPGRRFQEETWGQGDRGQNLPPWRPRSIELVPWRGPGAPSQLSGTNFCSIVPSWGEANGMLTPAPISEMFKVTSNKGWEKGVRIKACFLSVDWNVSVFFQCVCARNWEALVGMDSVRQKEKQYVWWREKQNILCVCLWAMGPWY